MSGLLKAGHPFERDLRACPCAWSVCMCAKNIHMVFGVSVCDPCPCRIAEVAILPGHAFFLAQAYYSPGAKGCLRPKMAPTSLTHF